MASIPAFGTSLLHNVSQNNPVSSTTSVEEILANTPQATTAYPSDSFEHSGGNNAPKKGFNWFNTALTLSSAAVIFMLGRRGTFGSKIQTWFGGRMSLNKVHKNIEAKISEYLGRDGVKVSSAKIASGADGNKVLTATFENGSVHTFAVEENKNFIKLSSLKKAAVAPSKADEVILFNRIDGSPNSRVFFARDNAGKVQEYASFKGDDILNPDFNEVSGVFKTHSQTAPKRRYFFGLFGPKEVKHTTKTFVNPDSGQALVTNRKYVYKHGQTAKIHESINGQKRTILFDDSGMLSKVKIKLPNGQVIFEHYEYTMTPQGKRVISGVRRTDAKGNVI